MIRIASSLTNRIFIASTLLAIVSLGLAFYFVNARVSSEAEADLRRSLTEAATLVDLRRENLTDTFRTMARLVADIPKLKASMADADAATAQPVADEYRQLISADLLVLTDPRGGVLGVSGGDAEPILRLGDPAKPLEEISTFVPRARGLLEAISVPVVTLDGDPPLVYGRLSVGFFMDDRLAARFKELTGTEVAFASQGKVLASSLPREARDTLSGVLEAPGTAPLTIGDQEYLYLSRPMPHDLQNKQRDSDSRGGSAKAAVPIMVVLQSRTERLSVLNSLRLGLAGALIITILLATLLSYFVARTVTRPLAAVTGAMGDVAATGDLTRKVPVRSRAWDDEDARLLASAFNTLTESIARFQREASQKERLSSLGRLSTVIAHEIRNPLMIIRATLTSLRRDHVSAADRLEAAADIDEETTRLNNLVSDVLDFAKPIRFDLAAANLNDVCRASAAAAWAGHDSSEVQLELDLEMPTAVTDAERMRTALINILTNARHAIHAAAGARSGGSSTDDRRSGSLDPPGGVAVASRPGVIVNTRYAAGRVAITIQDFGTGISADDMGHIFDPYFTTRRKGTGLGLPIAKTIIEGLGGTVTVTSQLGEGTAIRLDLPLDAEAIA